MSYLTPFHQQSTEQCLQELATLRNLPFDSLKQVELAKEMHRQLAIRYPNEK